jgi:dUTP pyrophosphatase
MPVGVGGALGREELARRIEGDQPLIDGIRSLGDQLQPNGVDLSVASVAAFAGSGSLARLNAGRMLPEVIEIPFDDRGWLDLGPGAYQVTFNETVSLPRDVMALGRPRSSLCRMGATLGTAVWDAGYVGRSTALLVVENSNGIRIQRDARLMQLVFFTLTAPTERGYEGEYQGENLVRPGRG